VTKVEDILIEVADVEELWFIVIKTEVLTRRGGCCDVLVVAVYAKVLATFNVHGGRATEAPFSSTIVVAIRRNDLVVETGNDHGIDVSVLTVDCYLSHKA
jgi:hypothetical protein